MHVIKVKNVREALPRTVRYLMLYGRKEKSRGGDVYAAAEPVCIQYTSPKEHVLIAPVRDANPFFHLMEAMWMLAGRNDAGFLDRYISTFSRDYSVDGIVMDAYGYRWRYGLHGDQLREIIAMLHKDATTRQCVLQMWGAGREDLWADKSLPCNLVATFRIQNYHLNMVVHNRSNDVVWGACGANAVHFALLQEYIADKIGVPMGQYWQISDNMHLYKDHINMLAKRAGTDSIVDRLFERTGEEYGETLDLMHDRGNFDGDLLDTLNVIDNLYTKDGWKNIAIPVMSNKFLTKVVLPMAIGHWQYKIADNMELALKSVASVEAADWRLAGTEWLQRRQK